MPLKIGDIAAQVQEMTAASMLPQQSELLAEARRRLRQENPATLREYLQKRTEASERRIPWLAALPTPDTTGSLADAFPAPATPANYSIAAADGSAIPPDRHSPLPYYVLNTGHAVLSYGAHPDAVLDSEGCLYFREEDLYIDADGQRIPVNESRLGIKMQVHEMQALLRAAGMAGQPAVALRDGSLIMWPLQSEEKTIQSHFLQPFLACLDDFHQAGFPVASYISYSNGQDVVNTLRVRLCPAQARDCQNCTLNDAERELCTFLGALRDRQLFFADDLLPPGARSQVFESTSAIQKEYREHRIRFFYLNVGGEIARIEAPAWVTDDPARLSLLHAAIMDQCRRSGGYPPYPPALMEAHEQAVIPTTDRRLVEEMVERALVEQGYPYLRSAKDRSKRIRAV
ncbi:MAG: DNA double-strand break repair nuclease NurA [Chloroflexota bacterium]